MEVDTAAGEAGEDMNSEHTTAAAATPKRRRKAASQNPFARSNPGSAPAIAAALLLVAFGCGIVLIHYWALDPATAGLRQQQTEQDGTLLARRLEDRIALLHTMADDIAKSAGVVAVLRDDLPLARHDLAEQLDATMPYLLRLRILPSGSARVALEEDPPLSFAGLDMIRRAEGGERTLPEALRVDGRSLPVINLARRIQDTRTEAVTILGSVLLTFDASILSDVLRRIDAAATVVTLEQRVGDSNRVAFIELGQASPNSLQTEFDLADSGWRLTYRADPAGLPPPALSTLDLLPGLGLILLGGLIGLLLGYSRLAASLRSDIAALVDSGSALIEGRDGLGAEHFELEPIADAARALQQAAATQQQQEPATAATLFPSSGTVTATAEASVLAANSSAADEDFLFIDDGEDPALPAENAALPSADIFRAYDIRGVIGSTLTEEVAYMIGRAIGSEAAAAGETKVVVAADGRHSSPGLRGRISAGIMATGLDVIDIGAVPTPILYFATHVTETRSGVMVTGSHNPPEYNGFKVVIGGETLAGPRISALRDRIAAGDFHQGSGALEERDLIPDYIDRIASDITLAQSLKVVADCGNGIAGKIIPSLLKALGCEVVPLYCEVDGDFPNHHPDPNDPANLQDLMTVVKAEGADIGLAFDGDGDRLGVVTERGDIIWPDRLMMLFARDIVGRNPGADVIFDVKCSRFLGTLIAEYGGRPIMGPTGHSHLKAKMKETQALLGGEFSGHICFGERWYGFDDGLYSAARLLEILASEAASASELFDEFPNPISTPELKISSTDQAKFQVIEALAAGADFDGGTLTTIDGLRVDYPEGWGLIRASNTSPVLTLRFEAEDAKALAQIQRRFREALKRVDSTLDFKT